MLFRNTRSSVVRLALILALLSGALGATNVQAAPLSEGDATTVLVSNTTGTPLAGKSVYAFDGSSYTGYSKVTDMNGEAVFTLPEGSYRFRVDVDGTQFWSGAENHCSNCLNVTVTIPEPVLVTVQDTDGTPTGGLNVYAFNDTTYTGFHGTSNQDGQVTLRLREGAYRFRADLNGTQFWSGTVNHCDIPGCESASVTVTRPMMVSVLDTNGTPKSGLNVYAFNGSTYTGYNKIANADGQAVFTLPLGSYCFRADLNGTQFWSGTANHCDIPGCESASVTVTQPMTVTVLDTDGTPKSGLNVYAFNGSTYTGYNKVTSADGQAVFTLPLGSYRFRADLNGTQFWSGAANHCNMPGCESASVTVTQPMMVTILDTDGAPKLGLNIYAFNGSTYTGYNKTTNADGQAVFTLPLGSYRFRADLNGTQFWSGTANHCDIPGCESAQVTVTVPMTVTIQDGGGVPKSGVSVYAFNGSTYTGYNKVSDANGQTIFTLPLGSYHFRADYSGVQYWSNPVNHCTLPGCSSASVTVGPAMTATSTPTPVPTDTPTPTQTYIPTYTPTAILFTISGNAGVAGATLQYTEDGISKTVVANSSGNYTIQVQPGWSGSIVPSKTNVTFNPSNRTYTSLQASVSAQNYTATITVMNSSDSGSGSLRQAFADVTSGGTIRFAPSLAGRTITLSSSVIIYNKKLILDGSGLSRQLTISGDNTAGLHLNGTSAVDIYDLTISDFNIPFMFRADATIRNSTLKGFAGAAITSYSPASLTITNSTFENNNGPVIVAYGPVTEIANSIFKNNTEDVIYSSHGSLTITNSTLSGNDGNAITAGGTATIINSTVMGNNGIGILANGSSLTLVNSTIYQNAREAFWTNGSAGGTVVNSTIAKNQGDHGQIFINGSSETDISNSIIVGDTNRTFSFNAGTLNLYNSLLVCTHNNECFLSTSGTVNWSDSVVFPGATWEELGLGEPVDNGGPTWTMALLPGSPLIDAGDDAICAASPVNNLDQRGVSRPQGAHCDIGAYEYEEENLVPTTTTIITSPNPSISGTNVNIHVTVTGNDGTPTGSVTITSGAGNCNIILSNGQGSCTLAFTDPGTFTIAAHYNGDNQYLTSDGTVSHTVMAAPPTSTYTPPPTATFTPSPTATFTVTPGPTPVAGCNSIRDGVGTIKFSGKTMYLDISNPNPYPVTISSVYVAWNYAAGHAPGDSSLYLQKAQLGATVFWAGNLNQPSAFLPFSTAVTIPASGTARITFTFDKVYNRPMGNEQIQIQFSTPGCEAYPVIVPAGSPVVTPLP